MKRKNNNNINLGLPPTLLENKMHYSSLDRGRTDGVSSHSDSLMGLKNPSRRGLLLVAVFVLFFLLALSLAAPT
jgi:hypothetical protein